MAHSVEITVSFYQGLTSSTVGFRYCPQCGEDIGVGWEGPWVNPCEHVMFCYVGGPERGFFNVHESVAQIVDRFHDLNLGDEQLETNWVIERVESDSVVFFHINPQPGEDAWSHGIAFDFGAEIEE